MSAESTSPELQLLEAERARLIACMEQLPEAQRTSRPAPEDWSVAEILEHLTQVERFITNLLITRGQAAPAEPAATAMLDEAKLTPDRAARIRDRSVRLQAPERIRPAGALGAAEALEALAAARAGLVAAFLASDPAVLDGVTQRHPAVGLLTLRGWVQFVAHHEARHAAQVEEIATKFLRKSAQ
jgi:DinB family protein